MLFLWSRIVAFTRVHRAAVPLICGLCLPAMLGGCPPADGDGTNPRPPTSPPVDSRPVVVLSEDRIQAPGSTIVAGGQTYDGTAGVSVTGLVGIVRGESAYLYHPALGDVELSEETSQRAVGHMIAQLLVDGDGTRSKLLDHALEIGKSTTMSTGVVVRRQTTSDYEFTNPKKRWVAIKRGADQPVFLPPRGGYFNPNVIQMGQLIASNFSTSTTKTVTINSSKIETFGAMASVWPATKIPLIGSSLKAKWQRAVAADRQLFMRLNAVEWIELAAEGIRQVADLDPTSCFGGPFGATVVTTFEAAAIGGSIADPDYARDRIKEGLSDLTQDVVLCACNATVKGAVVCVPLKKLLDILGNLNWIIDDGLIRLWNETTSDAYASLAHESTPPAQAPAVPGTPSPAAGATGVSVNADLDWADAARATSYDVYFGTTNPPPKVGNTTSSNWDLATLSYSTTYYWQVVAKNSAGSTPGPVWRFTTRTDSCSQPMGHACEPDYLTGLSLLQHGPGPCENTSAEPGPSLEFYQVTLPTTVRPGQQVLFRIDWNRCSDCNPYAVIYTSLIGDWAPSAPLYVSSAFFTSCTETATEEISFTAPRTTGQYRVRWMLCMAFEPLEEFCGTGYGGNAGNVERCPYVEVSFSVCE